MDDKGECCDRRLAHEHVRHGDANAPPHRSDELLLPVRPPGAGAPPRARRGRGVDRREFRRAEARVRSGDPHRPDRTTRGRSTATPGRRGSGPTLTRPWSWRRPGEARFSLWRVERRHEAVGLVVQDLLREDEAWLVDEALERERARGHGGGHAAVHARDLRHDVRHHRAGRPRSPPQEASPTVLPRVRGSPDRVANDRRFATSTADPHGGSEGADGAGRVRGSAAPGPLSASPRPFSRPKMAKVELSTSRLAVVQPSWQLRAGMPLIAIAGPPVRTPGIAGPQQKREILHMFALTPELLMAGGSVLATLGTGLATWLGFRRERVKIAQEHAEWLHEAEHKMRDGISARLLALQDRYGGRSTRSCGSGGRRRRAGDSSRPSTCGGARLSRSARCSRGRVGRRCRSSWGASARADSPPSRAGHDGRG